MSDANELSLTITRRFKVKPETVFDVFTHPESMKIWWGDDAQIETDVREGGHWTVVRWEEDMELKATGRFLEMERPHRVKFTFAMPQFSPNSDTLSVKIEPEENGCVLTFIHSGPDITEELRKLEPGVTSESEAGWQQGFDLMKAAWS